MTTLNLQIQASASDGYSIADISFFNSTSVSTVAGAYSPGALDAFALFDSGVSGLSGVTIDSALFTVNADASQPGSPLTKLFADDSASPTAPSTHGGHTAKTRTTAGVDWDGALTPNVDNTAPDITVVIQELADSYDPSAIQILHDDDGSTQGPSNYMLYATFDFSQVEGPQLDIIHSTGGGGGPLASRRLLSGTGR